MYSCYKIGILLVIGFTQLAQVELHHEHAHVPKDVKHHAIKKPLTFITLLAESFLVKNTGKSITVSKINAFTEAPLKGGSLSDKVFEFFKFEFFWHDNATSAKHYSFSTINGKEGARLESLVYYYNREYGTPQNAIKHPDGLLQVSVRISVIDSHPNPLFSPFELLFKKVKHAGDSYCAVSAATFFWYTFFPKDSSYFTYLGTYRDEETGQKYPATTIVLPMLPANYVSLKQFENTFGSLKNCSGGPLVNVAPEPQDPFANAPFQQTKGIVVIQLPF